MNTRENTILIVEDDALQALDLNLIVQQSSGSVVGTAFSAERALEIAKACRPFISIVDVSLGSLTSGLVLARHLYEHYQSNIIFVTGDPQSVRSAEPEYPYELLAKPVSRVELLRAIEAEFQASGSHQDARAQTGAAQSGF